MKINTAEFVQSSPHHEQCPDTQLPEFAFIGRSNVGKSSLINLLTGRKNLAKTSAKPGKTQLINHFLVNEQWHLVDLPGYGWAQVSKTKRHGWSQMIESYLLQRRQLMNLFVLIDSRLPPQKIDMEFIDWLGVKQIPFAIIFTKVDKQSINKTQRSIAIFKRDMQQTWAELPPLFMSSAVDRTGKENILEYIEQVLPSSLN
jgi:GTP-binding protein